MPSQPAETEAMNNQSLTWDSIHLLLQKQEEDLKNRLAISEGKGKIASGTYERSKRRLRSNLYEKFIKQYLEGINASEIDVQRFPELLDKAAHDEVLRTLLIKQVLSIIDTSHHNVFKAAELKLKNVAAIYQSS